jgi:ubiquinone/menaquinone biosynthesis C-methylase UbiE
MTEASTRRERTCLSGREPESLFECFPWLYAFCRNHLFRDDTKLIASALWSGGVPAAGNSLLELGCGSGFFSRRMTRIFGRLRIVGVDNSERQLLSNPGQMLEEMHRVLKPGGVFVMSLDEFGALVGSRPWASVRRWQDIWYQYAVCERGAE